MKIGIGVITCGVRPLHSLLEPAGAITATFTDLGRRGVAYSRNEVLHQLYAEGCDYFFLFDDDCYPVMPGWAEYFIEQAQEHCLDFLGLPEIFKSQLKHTSGEMNYWDSIVGCFSFQTRHMIAQIGYYNEAYIRYGYEDAGRNDRARRAMSMPEFPSPIRASSYIHSQDVFGEQPKPNMTVEAKNAAIMANRSAWLAELASPQLYYPYPRASA
jgi:hypothetical protein